MKGTLLTLSLLYLQQCFLAGPNEDSTCRTFSFSLETNESHLNHRGWLDDELGPFGGPLRPPRWFFNLKFHRIHLAKPGSSSWCCNTGKYSY